MNSNTESQNDQNGPTPEAMIDRSILGEFDGSTQLGSHTLRRRSILAEHVKTFKATPGKFSEILMILC